MPCVSLGGLEQRRPVLGADVGRGAGARGQRPTARRGAVARSRPSLISNDANSTRVPLDGRGVARELQREQALAHRRAGGEHVQPPVLQPAEQTGPDRGSRSLGRGGHARRARRARAGRSPPRRRPRAAAGGLRFAGAQREDRAARPVRSAPAPSSRRSAISAWISIRRSLQRSQLRVLAHDPPVVAGVPGCRHPPVELLDRAGPADLVELAVLAEHLGDGQMVDRAPALVQRRASRRTPPRAPRGRSARAAAARRRAAWRGGARRAAPRRAPSARPRGYAAAPHADGRIATVRVAALMPASSGRVAACSSSSSLQSWA